MPSTFDDALRFARGQWSRSGPGPTAFLEPRGAGAEANSLMLALSREGGASRLGFTPGGEAGPGLFPGAVWARGCAPLRAPV